jgi:WD40 repeat protein
MFLRLAFFVLGITLAAASVADAQERAGSRIVRSLDLSQGVLSVAIAPDGKTALSGSFDNTLRLWDLASGREIRTFEGHWYPVTSVAIAPVASSASW